MNEKNHNLNLESLHRKALVYVGVGLLWNPVEALVAFFAGLLADSPALIAFGLKSIIELFAGFVMIWRLKKGISDQLEIKVAEKKAERLIGITFFLLIVYLLFHSGGSILGWLPEPKPTISGIIIVIVSALVMTVLYVLKMRLAVFLQSRALRAEAIQSLMCDLHDLTILFGLGANILFEWWWADPVVALFLIPFLAKEGWSSFFEYDEELHLVRVCFCRDCFYGFRTCYATCCKPIKQT